MPRVGFICPDGEKIGEKECLAQCRMAERCVPRPILAAMAGSEAGRPVGQITATMLLQPATQMALKMQREYYEAPDSLTYAFRGTSKHEVLDKHSGPDALSEERLTIIGTVTGKPDQYEDEIVSDWKTTGAYKVKKALAALEKGGGLLRCPMQDGQVDFGEDFADWVVQLNAYRYAYLQAGFPVKGIEVWALVRDFNWMSKKQGVVKQWYHFPLEVIDEDLLLATLDARLGSLKRTLLVVEEFGFGEPCPKEETWGGRRCQGYCPVREYCPKPWA